VVVTADPRAVPATGDLVRWEPLTAQQVAELMRGFDAPWWIAGGWALDLYLGRQTRAHNDIEVAVFRDDEAKLRRHLRAWEHFTAEGGTLTPVADDEPLPAAAHELWSRERGRDAWQLEILVEEREGDRWTYRRDPRIGLRAKDLGRFSNDGIPYIRPDVQLLYKSKDPRPVDESDLLAALPRLDTYQRATLAAWIGATNASHRWLDRLK
jgi:hypothetical protein